MPQACLTHAPAATAAAGAAAAAAAAATAAAAAATAAAKVGLLRKVTIALLLAMEVRRVEVA